MSTRLRLRPAQPSRRRGGRGCDGTTATASTRRAAAGAPTLRQPASSPSRANRRAVAGLGIGVLALLAAVPACSSPSPPTTALTTTSSPASTSSSTTTSVTVPHQSSAQVAQCESDAKSLEVALEAYMVQRGAFPTPATWNAATYATNFAPLIPSYLPSPPATTSYVIEYDSAGHVWVAPPGSYGATYNPGQGFDTNPNVCLAASG